MCYFHPLSAADFSSKHLQQGQLHLRELLSQQMLLRILFTVGVFKTLSPVSWEAKGAKAKSCVAKSRPRATAGDVAVMRSSSTGLSSNRAGLGRETRTRAGNRRPLLIINGTKWFGSASVLPALPTIQTQVRLEEAARSCLVTTPPVLEPQVRADGHRARSQRSHPTVADVSISANSTSMSLTHDLT